MKYIKKPVEIEAIDYTSNNIKECQDFLEGNYRVEWDELGPTLYIKTLFNGEQMVMVGDYIVKETGADYTLFYTCDEHFFVNTHDKITEDGRVIDIDEFGSYINEEDELNRLKKENEKLKNFVINLVLSSNESEHKELPIFKKYIDVVNNGFTLCGNYYDEKDFKKEDFRKIMEWLKND